VTAALGRPPAYPPLRQSVNRFADANSARITEAMSVGLPLFGDVKSVTPGTPPTITITWFGMTCPARYLNSYTPVLGDRVAFGYDGKQIVVFGKVIG
jgi:hypothetical protein